MVSSVVSPRLTRFAGVTALTAVALLGVAGVAGADSPRAGDDRAVVHAGNVTTCDQAGLAGDTIQVTNTIDDSNTYIDITAVPDGMTVTAVVVKGGPNYNVYLPDALGELAWQDLHAPLVPSDKPAQISHWFVCATAGGSTTTSSTPTTTVPSTPGGSTETSAPGAGGPAPSTPAAQGDQKPLASTGFGNSWLVVVGGALLIGGAALLLLVRRRSALSGK